MEKRKEKSEWKIMDREELLLRLKFYEDCAYKRYCSGKCSTYWREAYMNLSMYTCISTTTTEKLAEIEKEYRWCWDDIDISKRVKLKNSSYIKKLTKKIRVAKERIRKLEEEIEEYTKQIDLHCDDEIDTEERLE